MPDTNIIEQYKNHLAGIGKSRNTVKAYSLDLTSFVQWWELTTGELFKPQVIDSRDIVEYRSALQLRGRAPATINRHLNALSKFFRWARQQDLKVDNPFDALEGVFVKVQTDIAPGWLDNNQQLALLRPAKDKGNKRDVAIIQTLLGTGLRISELVALETSDLDISERRGTLSVRSGKGMKQREIPLDKKTRVALTTYLGKRLEAKGEPVFLGQRGPLTERGIDQLIAKYAYQARLENCTAHSLRHSFAKNLVDAGTPLDQVAILLGHESLNTTRVYTKPSRQDLERAVRHAAGEYEG
jgi:integrase/recombinase XerC